jgi:signal transduction histidine kinase/ActR/RegA family two-component response regulator
VGRGLFGVRKNGEEFQVEIGFTPIETDEGRKVRLTVVDITDRVQLEGRLRQAQKMEAVGRLTAGVAHDFNNILQGIVGGLELVMDDLAEGTPAQDLANVAINAAMRGSSLTQHLLSYSRKQMLRPERIAIGPFLEDMQKLLSRTLGPHIDIKVAVNHAPCVLADSGLLQTALLNLAINAAHAMPRDGTLNMDTREEREAGTLWVVIAITDTGTGMDEAVRAQAVEPFFTTKGLDGSGLGLSMVQGFAEQSGGRLQIMSTLGQGTTVELWLPAAINGSANQTSGGDTTQQAPARILLVDDSADILITTGAFLEKAGFTVVRVVSGDQALALLASGEHFDALVTDHAMPGLNGADLIAEARAIHPDLPCVIITGFAAVNFEDRLPDGTPVLHKPFQRAELIEALHTVMPQTEPAVADAPEPVAA